MIKEYDGQGNLVKEISTPVAPAQKSVLAKDEFIALIPKKKLRAIQAAATNGDDDINVWLFNLNHINKIDLNSLPLWFTEGVEAMVSNQIFTQQQVDNFLER